MGSSLGSSLYYYIYAHNPSYQSTPCPERPVCESSSSLFSSRARVINSLAISRGRVLESLATSRARALKSLATHHARVLESPVMARVHVLDTQRTISRFRLSHRISRAQFEKGDPGGSINYSGGGLR